MTTMTKAQFEKWQDEWFQKWRSGQIADHYPCGCVGRLDPKDRALVIAVKQGCPYDEKKIGYRLSWLRYVGWDTDEGKAARELPY